MTDLELLINLARFTRTVFEKESRLEDLAGMCYDASCFLHTIAKAYGIETRIGAGVGHYFVVYNNMIIDVTATQFGIKEKVVIIPIDKAKEVGRWWDFMGFEDVSYPEYYRKKDDAVVEGLIAGVGEGEL
jgi:hypothetical protein